MKFPWGHWKVWWYSRFFYMFLFLLLPAPKLLGSSFYSYSIEISCIMTQDGFLLLILLGIQWALSNCTLVFLNLGSFLCYFFNNFSLSCFFLSLFFFSFWNFCYSYVGWCSHILFCATCHVFVLLFGRVAQLNCQSFLLKLKFVDDLFWVISFLQTPVISGLWTGT